MTHSIIFDNRSTMHSPSPHSYVLILLVALLSACGARDDSFEEYWGLLSNHEASTPDAPVESFEFCAEGECNPSVGALIRKNPETGLATGACSGTYIGENRIVTAAHCVHPLHTASSCVGLIEAFFPHTAQIPSERHGCKRVLYSSFSSLRDNFLDVQETTSLTVERAVSDFDVAVIELETTPAREAIPLGLTASTAHGEALQIGAIDLYRGPKIVSLTKNCRSTTTSFYWGKIEESDSGIALARCEVKPGYSGGGIFTADGALVGVVQSIPFIFVQGAHQAYRETTESFAPTSYGSKVRCAPIFGDADRSLGDCVIRSSNERQSLWVSWAAKQTLGEEYLQHSLLLEPRVTSTQVDEWVLPEARLHIQTSEAAPIEIAHVIFSLNSDYELTSMRLLWEDRRQ